MFFLRVAAFAIIILMASVVSTNAEAVQPSIVINLPSRTLEFYSGANLIKEYPVAIGKAATPTPVGSFSIINKEVNPWWFPPRKNYGIPPGPDNPLGYRWMGFLPLYGIHGTNAPWAIGGTVSNGCVRMYEEDIEEIFDKVPYGTPVRVTYDRVKVRVDAAGYASIGIYPDVYGYSGVSVSDVRNHLEALGLNHLVTDEFILRLIEEERDEQIVFARLHSIKVNNKPIPEKAVTVQGVMYVPVWPVAASLMNSIAWDAEKRLIIGPKQNVPGIVKGGILYVAAADVQILFGGQQVWGQEENCLAINTVTLYHNGKAITNDVQSVGGILAVPALVLAQATGAKAVWDEVKGSLTINGKSVPVSVIARQPYIQITEIYNWFKAYVYWNQSASTIELTYPFKDGDN